MADRTRERRREAALRRALALRRAEVEAARRDLVSASAAADAARRRDAFARGELGREAEAAGRIDVGDGAVEAFAAWLPQGRRAAAAARALSEEAEAAVAVARGVLAAARSAEAAVEALIERQAETARVQRRRAEDRSLLDRPATPRGES